VVGVGMHSPLSASGRVRPTAALQSDTRTTGGVQVIVLGQRGPRH
jgi:hypothetical protein